MTGYGCRVRRPSPCADHSDDRSPPSPRPHEEYARAAPEVDTRRQEKHARESGTRAAVRCAPCPTTSSLPRSRSDCKGAHRSQRGSGPARSTTSSARQHLLGPGQAAPRAHRGRPALVGDPLGTARHRQDDDRAPGRGRHREGVRAAVGGHRGREGRARGRRARPCPHG